MDEIDMEIQMLSLEMAQKLKDAGLEWFPRLNDFFGIPDRGFEDKIFVLSDLLATVEVLFGKKVVSFQGAPEWALDSILVSEVVWIPSETQLRQSIEYYLSGSESPWLSLTRLINGLYQCRFEYHHEECVFESDNPNEAYALGLLHILQNR